MIEHCLTSKYDISFWVYEFSLCSHYNVTQNSKILNCIRNWKNPQKQRKKNETDRNWINWTKFKKKRNNKREKPKFHEQWKKKQTKIECATGTHSFGWTKFRLILFPLSLFQMHCRPNFFRIIFIDWIDGNSLSAVFVVVFIYNPISDFRFQMNVVLIILWLSKIKPALCFFFFYDWKLKIASNLTMIHIIFHWRSIIFPLISSPIKWLPNCMVDRVHWNDEWNVLR